MLSVDELKKEYEQKLPGYKILCKEIVIQLNQLLKEANIISSYPIESRVKSWNSIEEKCKRNQIEAKSIEHINDIAGIRIIVLFARELKIVRDIINKNFDVTREENTSDRLSENQFGYGSIHFEVKPKNEWYSLPTLRSIKGLTAEIQVRTASQHIWAASSHILQYKSEAHVPIPLRRTINRVAALLEIVDYEFERVLEERQLYLENTNVGITDVRLNTDILRSKLDLLLPLENKTENEDYANLLDDLLHFNIDTSEKLTNIINKYKKEMIETDKEYVNKYRQELDNHAVNVFVNKDRIDSGVYLTHVGLVRFALTKEFGSEELKKMHNNNNCS